MRRLCYSPTERVLRNLRWSRSALASVRAPDSRDLRLSVPALAPVRSGDAGRVARTPFGLLPSLPLGTPFRPARTCRWAGGNPGNLLRGAVGCRITLGLRACGGQQRSSPQARPHPSPLPEGEGTSSACQWSITLTVRPRVPL